MVLVLVTRDVERILPLIPLLDLDKMIGVVKIDLGEDVGPLQNPKRQQDEW